MVAGEWAIVQASFEQMESAVFLLHKQGDGYRVASTWGGVVEYPGQIQAYFAKQVPNVLPALLACYQPSGQFAR